MAVYTYPSKKALLSIMTKVRALTKKARHHGLADLLGRLNPVLRGWCAYFRHGVSKQTFRYLCRLRSKSEQVVPGWFLGAVATLL